MHLKKPFEAFLFNSFGTITMTGSRALVMSCALLTSCVLLTSCATLEEPKANVATTAQVVQPQPQACAGEVVAPPLFVPLLTEVEDKALVAGTLKAQGEGGLCQAKAYRVNKPFEVFRAWNSNNPGSEKGQWWSFNIPSGKISEYRQDFAICPKWSPLDMMTRCTVKEGTHLVLGTGQSAHCNPYLTYEKSPDIQIYMNDASQTTMECKTYYGIFSWQESH